MEDDSSGEASDDELGAQAAQRLPVQNWRCSSSWGTA